MRKSRRILRQALTEMTLMNDSRLFFEVQDGWLRGLFRFLRRILWTVCAALRASKILLTSREEECSGGVRQRLAMRTRKRAEPISRGS